LYLLVYRFNVSVQGLRYGFRFVNSGGGASCLEALDSIGSHMCSVSVIVDQQDSDNRSNACKALVGLAKLPERRLRSIKVRFIGENPVMYVGQEFVDSLNELFGPPGDSTLARQHTDVR
jgi:hypothetical protein